MLSIIFRKKNTLMLLGLLVISYFSLFYYLDAYGLLMWDEARNAVSAYEMSVNGDYIVRYVDGYMDDWELKPPMLMWVQIIVSKFTGFNELAIRLPSALAAFAVVLCFFYFFKKQFDAPLAGFLSALVLVSSSGYVGEHVTRTGDHDSLVICFMVLSALAYFKYLHDEKTNTWLIIMPGVLIGFAVLTKSVIGISFVPGMLIYTLLSGSLPKLLKDKNVYFAAGVLILIIASYYISREQLQPGYLQHVWKGELFPRYTNEENRFIHEDSFYYYNNFFAYRFYAWIYFLLPSCLFILIGGDIKMKRILLYLVCIGSVFFYTISTGSKNFWYDAPLYPIMAMIIGLGFYSLIMWLNAKTHIYKWIAFCVCGIFIGTFSVSYYVTFRKMMAIRNINYGAILYKEYTEHLFKTNQISTNVKAYHNRMDAAKSHLLFYSYTMPDKIVYHKNVLDYRVGEKVMSCDEHSVKMLHNEFELDTIDTYKTCVLLEIMGRKQFD